MAKVIYPGPYEAVQLPDGTVCAQGVPVDVDDAIAASLINQGFTDGKGVPAPVPAPTTENGDK